jgi:hypothetical protein
MNRIFPFVLLAGIAGCASTYVKTAGDFASTTSDSVKGLQPASGFRGTLCHDSARFDYAFHRLKGPVVNPQTQKPVSIVDYEQVYPYMDGGESWSKLCAEHDVSDKVVANALGALGSYADALAKLTSDDFPGKNIASLATSASALAKQISADSKASKVAASLADPISSIAGAIATQYKRHAIAEVVAKNDAAIARLIGGVGDYLAAVGEESQLARHNLGDALKAADAGMAAGDVLAYVALATQWTNELDDLDGAMAAARASLAKLGDAETKLRKADGNDDAPELKDLLGDLTLILQDVQAVQTAVGGKASS